MSFSFSFSGDDIEEEAGNQLVKEVFKKEDSKPAASAFPVQGKPQLPPTQHDLAQMLSQLPSKIAYSFLDVELEDGSAMSLPRRELWDVRVQLMAEDDGSGSVTEGLGSHDVKTGVYEGGFKSWESSLDLVQVLATEPFAVRDRASHVIEVSSTVPKEFCIPCQCKR
jgi:protein-histidine N-methyltransferase